MATTTCATFPEVFSNVDECWLTTNQQSQTQIRRQEQAQSHFFLSQFA